MAELSNQIIRDLARLRVRGAPSAAIKQRVLSAIEIQIGGGGGGGDGGDPGSDLGSDLGHAASAGGGAKLVASAGYAAKVVGATLALTGAGLLSLKLGATGLSAAKSKAQATDPIAAVEIQEPSAASEPADSSTNPAPSESAAAAAEVSTEDAEPASEDVGAKAVKPRSPKAVTAPSDSEDSDGQSEPSVDKLALELAILDAARKAGSLEVRLDELERHRSEYPEGQLADERELMRVETLCSLGRLEDARRVAKGFSSSHPESSLGPRMRRACPELGL